MEVFKNKNILIFGYERSGRTAVSLLKKVGAHIFVYDDKLTAKIMSYDINSYKLKDKEKKSQIIKDKEPKIVKKLKSCFEINKTSPKSKTLFAEILEKDVCFLENFNDFLKFNINLCVISPGISLENPKIEILKKEKIKIISELELGAFFCKGKIFAITGTNGKTTSVHLLYKIFLTAKKKCFLCGNVGIPICEIAHLTTPDCLIVCEVSSFQLETTKKIYSFASAILNLQPDHLNRHKAMENYVNIKKKINKYYKTKKIFNIDDEATFQLSKEYNSAIECSAVKKTNGCYIDYDNVDIENNLLNNLLNIENKDKKNGFIYYKNQKIMPINKIKLVGIKNLENILCTIALAKQVKIKNRDIQNAVENFKSLPNRLELVGKIHGITFINDSKSTNVLSTLMALDSIGDKVILLLGGSNKNLDFSPIFKHHKIKVTIAYGESKQKIIEAAKNTNLIKAQNFNDACLKAFEIAKKHDIVLLSPSCASFDEFSSFEERGKQFKKNIKDYFKK